MNPLLRGLLLSLPVVAMCASIVDVISAIAQHENRALPEGLELCFVQLRPYSERDKLNDVVYGMMKSLASRYPTTIASQNRSVFMYGRREASMVLLDATGYSEEFPSVLGSQRLHHECYSMSAKFIAIVDATTNRSMLVRFFRELGLVNYLAIPLDPRSDPPDHSDVAQLLYTANPYTGQEYLFDVRDHDDTGAGRYYPNKLANVNGYEFLGFALYQFPYVFVMSGNRTAGLLIECLRHLIVRQLNGTLRMVRDERANLGARTEFDLTFAYTEFRVQRMHDVMLKERDGNCALCPFRTERDFLRHLLKPFSFGIWLVLGALLVVCHLLGRFFPHRFQRSLLEHIFFTGSVPHRQRFPTRIVSFAVTVLIFFLSEAYNAKIISLMSVSKYYQRPETFDELLQSDFMIAIPGVRASLLAEALPGKLLPVRRADALYREQGERMFGEYCTVTYCYMAKLTAAVGRNKYGFQQYVLRETVMDKVLTVQLATRSPFHRTFVEHFERYFQSGIWTYRLQYMNSELSRGLEPMRNRIEEVIFHFEDLGCIWLLIVVGWTLGAVAFVAELVWLRVRYWLCNSWKRSNLYGLFFKVDRSE